MGFQHLSPEARRAIASKGGKALSLEQRQKLGRSLTPLQRQDLSSRGGKARQRKNPESLKAAQRAGGKASGAKPNKAGRFEKGSERVRTCGRIGGVFINANRHQREANIERLRAGYAAWRERESFEIIPPDPYAASFANNGMDP